MCRAEPYRTNARPLQFDTKMMEFCLPALSRKLAEAAPAGFTAVGGLSAGIGGAFLGSAIIGAPVTGLLGGAGATVSFGVLGSASATAVGATVGAAAGFVVGALIGAALGYLIGWL